MRIGICDQTKQEVNCTEQFLRKNVNAESVVYKTYLPEEAAIDIEEKTFSCDIFVTEIVFNDLKYDGLCLAKTIKKARPDCKIIFFAEYVPDKWDIYEVEHSYLVLKEHRDDRLVKAVCSTIGCLESKKQDYVRVSYDGAINVFSSNEIICIKRDDRLAKYYTTGGEFPQYISLRELEKTLPDTFVRVNGGCIVNKAHIKSVSGNEVVMCTGESVKIGRVYKDRLWQK